MKDVLTSSPAEAGARAWVPDRIRARAGHRERTVRDAVALRTAGEQVTYAELWERAGKQSAELSALGIGRGDLVALRLPSGPGVVVAMLACWLAGAAFLPMDAAAPDAYRDQVSGRSGARAVIDGDGPRAVAGARPGAAARLSAGGPRDQAAYVIYTSGSTGVPKGVLVGHDALAGHTAAMADLLELGRADTVPQFAGLGFDVAQEEIWPTLTAGGTVAFLDSAARALSPRDLARQVRDLGATVLQLPTAYWRLISGQIRGTDDPDLSFAGVRTVVIGGEAAGAEDVRTHRDGPLGHCTLVNGYGPTETVVTCTALVLRAGDPVPATVGLPIGGPVGARLLRILDADQRPAAPATPGELWIGGGPLADGYLGDPERTAERFRPDPFTPGGRMYRTGDLVLRHEDGAVEFLGRLDNQVKIRGHRIELDEVDRHLVAAPGVTAAAAVALDDGAGGHVLAAAVTVTPDGPTADQVRAHIGGHCPRYMVPGVILVVAALPLTTSGKIDRKAVAALAAGHAASSTAATAAESGAGASAQPDELALLLDLLRPLLRAPDFGPDDDFLARGGDSLVALRVSGAMRERGWRLRASDLMAVGSARAVAARMQRCATERTHRTNGPEQPRSEGRRRT